MSELYQYNVINLTVIFLCNICVSLHIFLKFTLQNSQNSLLVNFQAFVNTFSFCISLLLCCWTCLPPFTSQTDESTSTLTHELNSWGLKERTSQVSPNRMFILKINCAEKQKREGKESKTESRTNDRQKPWNLEYFSKTTSHSSAPCSDLNAESRFYQSNWTQSIRSQGSWVKISFLLRGFLKKCYAGVLRKPQICTNLSIEHIFNFLNTYSSHTSVQTTKILKDRLWLRLPPKTFMLNKDHTATNETTEKEECYGPNQLWINEDKTASLPPNWPDWQRPGSTFSGQCKLTDTWKCSHTQIVPFPILTTFQLHIFKNRGKLWGSGFTAHVALKHPGQQTNFQKTWLEQKSIFKRRLSTNPDYFSSLHTSSCNPWG